MNYTDLKQKHQAEVDAFPLGAAFSDKQFTEMMEKWGLTESDVGMIYSIGHGCYIRRTDSAAFREMFDRHEAERQRAIDGDKTGEGYIYQMFAFELANHEYGYTGRFDETFEALDLTYGQVVKNERLRRGLNKALKKYGSRLI